MADVNQSAAWLTADIAALLGGYLSLPMNVCDGAASVANVIVRHQVWCSAFCTFCIPLKLVGLLLRDQCRQQKNS
jgi:hypothetical protein